MKEKIDSDRLAKYFPLVVLAIGVAISLFSYNEIRAQRIDQNWKEYFRRTEEIVNRIQGRLNAFEGILLSAAGLLAASTEVTRDEFKTFVKTLRLDQSYPGVQGVGFSQRILPSELEFHQKKIRQSGFPQYTISPPGVRDIYTSIIFLEPFEGRNLRAFGYDMYSEPVRRQAMDRAMRTGQSAMSGKVVLVQETEKDIQPGFLIYVPVYKNLPDDPSEEDRVRCLIGWSYSPFRMRDLMAGVLGQYWTQSEMGIVFSIYDGENISAEAQLHESHFDQSDRSHERRFKSQQKITFLGRTWTFNFHADSQFFTGGDIVNREKLALVFGIFMSIGLSSIIWILMSSRDRAVKYAQEVNRNLIESEERFRNMANSAPVLIWISDPENYMTWFNKVWLDFTGRRISQELKEGWLEGVHPEDRELCRQVHRQCFSDQKPFTIEFQLKRHDGVYRWVLDAGVPRFSEKGEFYGYIGSCLDISEMKKNISDRIQAEKKLSEAFEKIKEQKRRLDLVIWGTKTATWDWNIKTGETTFNDRWAEIIGYQLSELEPVDINTWIKYTHPDDLAESGRQLERHFRGETDLYSCEARMKHKNGHWVWILDCGRVYAHDKDGSPLLMAGTHQDITAQKIHEQEILIAKQNAEEATQLKDKFVNLVSHDLKNPLGLIINYLNLALKKISPVDERDLSTLLKRAQSGAFLMNSLIHDILSLSRFKSGRIKLDTKFFDLSELCLQAVEENKAQAEQKEISLLTDVPSHLRLWGDRSLIGEALRNLITNAIKFSKKSDVITIRAAIDGQNTVISVVDSGPGMSSEALNRILQSGAASSTLGTAGEAGTGFGLVLIHDLMKLHHGSVSVMPNSGGGSIFQLTLPTVKPQILVVDYDSASRELMQAILGPLDVEILEAEDGEKAFALIAQRRPHLIIANFHGPHLCGMKLLEKLKRKDEIADIPVVVTASEQEAGEREIAFRLGAQDFITNDAPVEGFSTVDGGR